MGGHAKTFGPMQSLVLDQGEGLGTGLSTFGEKVVQTALDTSAGRRILLDVKHMSVQCRKDYYALLQSLREAGDTVPVMATHVGVAGCSWFSEGKKDASWLSDWEISLFDEDMREIHLSHGILGIMPDKYRIAGPRGNKWVKDCPEGSAQQRQAYVKLLALNMLEVVDALQCKEAWDLISIGSDYDGMINAMEPYASARDFPDLRGDLLTYFSNPTDLWDEWPSNRVRNAMYGLSAEEIVDKVMGGNLIRFTQATFERHLHLPAEKDTLGEKP
jgi:microsomal dipeptidase-like Zn-dependent dipeptidase